MSKSFATMGVPTQIKKPVWLYHIFEGWLLWFVRSHVISALRRAVVIGSLHISDPELGSMSFGESSSEPPSARGHHASLVIKDQNFWLRFFISYDIGFSESYMAGEIESPDLKAILNLYVDNSEYLDSVTSPIYKLLSFLAAFSIRYFRHGLSGAVENAAGYGTSNDLYSSFLGKEMMYSCALWGEEEGGIDGDLKGKRSPGDLEAAQTRKIAHCLAKANLRPGDRLLEIGSGWASLAIAAGRMGCTVDTLTVSGEQAEGAKEKIRLAGLEGKVRVHLLDYREMPPEFENSFDACISNEMLEAVGVGYMRAFFMNIDWALKKDRATIVFTSSTYPENVYTPYQRDDFCRKYHWPNGVSPSPTSLLVDFQSYIPGRFYTSNIEDMGANYPRTIREWGRRFEENWNEKLAMSLQIKYPALKFPPNMEAFRRKWRYMFLYMEIAYTRRCVSITCWTMSRPGPAYSRHI